MEDGAALIGLAGGPNRPADEAEIRVVIERWAQALRQRSAADAMALHAPGIVSFDLSPPLRYVGQDDYRRAWDAAFALFCGPIAVQISDLNVVVGDKVAFSYSLNHIQGATRYSSNCAYWFRWTAAFQKIGGRWLIVHDHTSLPTDFVTGLSRQDLAP